MTIAERLEARGEIRGEMRGAEKSHRAVMQAIPLLKEGESVETVASQTKMSLEKTRELASVLSD